MLAAEATAPTTQQAPAPAPPVSLTPAQVFQQQQAAAPQPSAAKAILWGVLILGASVGFGALHGQWAYGDWTCAFKNCVAVAPVRRRRKR